MQQYYLFVDESGDSSLKSINHEYPVFSLLGILISAKEYERLNQRLDRFKMRFFDTTEVILHSRDIRKCNGPYAKLFDLDFKRKFYRDLDRIMAETDYKIVASVINKNEHLERYGKLADDPYEIGLTFLLERALYELEEVGGQADVVIESRGDKEDDNLAAKFNQLITRGSQKVAAGRFVVGFGTKVNFRRKIQNDNGLQIADLCAYPTACRILRPNEPQPAFDTIAGKFRKSSRGEIRGYGIEIFP